MPQLSFLRVGLLAIVLIGLLGVGWLIIRGRQALTQPTSEVTDRAADLVGILGQNNGLFSVVKEPGSLPVYIANSRDQAIVSVLRPLVGQTVTLRGKRASNDTASFYLESVNNQTINSTTTSFSPGFGLSDIYANLPASQQSCLKKQLNSTVLDKLLTEPAYQLTPADSQTLDMCLNQSSGGL